jgi:hypothetical protein
MIEINPSVPRDRAGRLRIFGEKFGAKDPAPYNVFWSIVTGGLKTLAEGAALDREHGAAVDKYKLESSPTFRAMNVVAKSGPAASRVAAQATKAQADALKSAAVAVEQAADAAEGRVALRNPMVLVLGLGLVAFLFRKRLGFG